MKIKQKKTKKDIPKIIELDNNPVREYLKNNPTKILSIDYLQKNIPLKSSINQKTSNLFGSATYNLSKNINLDYDFSIDNDLKSFEKNIIGLNFSFLEDSNAAPKFNTNFRFSKN